MKYASLFLAAATVMASPLQAADTPSYSVTFFPNISHVTDQPVALMHGQIIGYARFTEGNQPIVWADPEHTLQPPLPRRTDARGPWYFEVEAADDHAFVSTMERARGDAFLAVWTAFDQPPRLIPLPNYDLIRPYDICGNQIVGYAKPEAPKSSDFPAIPDLPAFVCIGSTFISLITTPGQRGRALTTDGNHQYGELAFTPGAKLHPVMWNSSANHPVDFLPPKKTTGAIHMARKNLKVGQVDDHAALWAGAPSTYRDLNPPGFAQSDALATNGTLVVGSAATTAFTPPPLIKPIGAPAGTLPATTAPAAPVHAFLWTNGNPLDLQQFIPAPWTNSNVVAIDAEGDILGRTWHDDQVSWIVWQPGRPKGGATTAP